MKLRSPIIAFAVLFLILQVFILQVEGGATTNTLYAHSEKTTLIGGNIYYTLKLSSADGPATTLSQSAAYTGRKEMGRWIYPLTGIVSIQASTWTVTYRAMKSASASQVVAHADVNILIIKSDNTIRTTIATNVANSPLITSINAWQTLTGTYYWPGYIVVDETDYLEVIFCIDVTQKQSSKSVRLLVDDGSLPLADQTKIGNVMFAYPNQPPVASFTYSPDYPVIYETVTFDASASYDADGSITSYAWDFGDGNVTTVTNPIIAHIYTTAASQVNYTVTLTVTDNGGSTDSTAQNVLVTNPTILRVSLPAGTYVGPDGELWLSQCWLLDNTGPSGTFTVRISNTACGVTSYDTHLIVALNDAAHQYFGNLIIGTTTIPKDAFTNGTPKPYGFTLTWEEDVYPTWFSDIYVVGDINPNSYKDVEVSASFSDATGVRVHFDAYGSKKHPPPSCSMYVIHNPHEKDSTVSFWPLPIIYYYLTVKVEPPEVPMAIPGEGWYSEGSNAELTASEYVDVSTDTRYRFDYWDVDGAFKSGNPITVVMDRNHTATAHYVLQYYLTVSSPYGTTGGEGFYDKDFTAYATITPLIVSGPLGTQYVFAQWSSDATGYTSPSDPIIMNGPKTATANWKTQYYLDVSSPYGTPGGEGWYESFDTAYATVTPLVAPGPLGTQYVFTHWSGDAAGNTSPSDPIIMNGPKTATANWKTQYTLTVRTSGLGTKVTNIYNGTVFLGNATDAVPFVGYFDQDSLIYLNVDSPIYGSPTRYVFDYWSGDASGSERPILITVSAPNDIYANYKTQYKVTFNHTGLDDSATGTVVTVNEVPVTYNELPYEIWVDSGSRVDYSYNDIVSSTVAGKQFKLIDVTGPSSPITVTGTVIVAGNYKTQYRVIFDQTGVETDFTGPVVTIDGFNYYVGGLPASFWWDYCSYHSFSFASPLVVNTGKQYAWQSTSGLSNLQSETLHITTSGSVIGSYIVKNRITFDQTGVSPDFTGTIVVIDDTPYSTLPVSFQWEVGSIHTFAFQSPLVVNPTAKQYVWIQTTGLSDKQGGSISVTTFGSIIGHYKTQYYLTVSSPYGTPGGQGFYDDGFPAYATVTPLKVPGPPGVQYVFTQWSGDATGTTSPSNPIIMNGPKTATANWKTQYYLDVSSPYGSPSPTSGWFDGGSVTASVTSPWPGLTDTQYICTGWIGTGNVPPTGTGITVTFTINQPSSIKWLWKTQYFLTVQTNPKGITAIPGQSWYDNSTGVSLTAPYVAGYEFEYWDVDGTTVPGNPINVHLDRPHTATAHYQMIVVPVGGYSVSLAERLETTPLVGYIMILAILGAAMTLIRRKRK